MPLFDRLEQEGCACLKWSFPTFLPSVAVEPVLPMALFPPRPRKNAARGPSAVQPLRSGHPWRHWARDQEEIHREVQAAKMLDNGDRHVV
jgi:hypothetical protein